MNTIAAPSRISIAVLFTLLFLLSAYPVIAQDLPAGRKDATSTGITRKEAVKERVETRKEIITQRLEDSKAKIASREAALKEKLAAFRDKQKANLVERISNSLKMINEKMVAHFNNVLQRLATLLTKLEDRVNSASPDIKDASLAKEAIADAKDSIVLAQEAVTAQASKDYTIQVSTENRVRVDAKAAKEKLLTDLKAVRETVIEAKKAVSNAIRVAKSGKEATNSGSQ